MFEMRNTCLGSLLQKWFGKQNTSYEELCSHTDIMPVAKEGFNSKVYLPEQAPDIVIKSRKFGGLASHSKKEIDIVRSLVKELGCRHLIVPWTKEHNIFLIAERLPIVADNHHNWHLYCREARLFDEAVREMARLYSKSYGIDYLETPQSNGPFVYINRENNVKYENLPLYIVNNGKREGRIGLIDTKFLLLERLDRFPLEKRFQDLAQIFPLHLDILIEEAKKLPMNLDQLLREKEIEGIMAPLRLQKVRPIDVTSETMNKLTTVIQDWLISLNWSSILQKVNENLGYRTPDGKMILEEIQAAKSIAPEILRIIIDTANECLNDARLEKRINSAEVASVQPFVEQLCMAATYQFKRRKLSIPLDRFLQHDPRNQKYNWTKKEPKLPTHLAIEMIYRLSRLGEISKYNSQYWTGPEGECILIPWRKGAAPGSPCYDFMNFFQL